MGLVLDSSVIIELERHRADLDSKIRGREDQEFFISVITANELLHGVFRAKDAATRSKRSAFVEAVLERFPILSLDLSTARIHAQLWAKLQSQGQSIGLHDSWIAATCIAHGHSLGTRNAKEFKRAPGLSVEQWF